MVVALAEFADAVDTVDDSQLSLLWCTDGVLVGERFVGRHAVAMPPCPTVATSGDALYLSASSTMWRGAVIDTEYGEITIPPDLVAHLHERGASVVRFGRRHDDVYLVAETGVPGPGVASAVVVAPVQPTGATMHPDEPARPERRRGGQELQQLLLALDSETPVSTLLELLDTATSYVQRRVAADARLPATVIDSIAKDGTTPMRAAVASNPAIGVDALRRLSTDPVPAVRAAVAANPALPPDVRDALTRDLNPEVHGVAAAARRDSPPEP